MVPEIFVTFVTNIIYIVHSQADTNIVSWD